MSKPITAVVVMGVSGCGKSCVGESIANHVGGYLIEGDQYHPPANIEKMSAGIPLDDDDRADWLTRLGQELVSALESHPYPVLTCSSLKRKYRERLRAAVPGLGFVFLELSREEAAKRVGNRPGHFMPASLTDSQFAALEPPAADENAVKLDATGDPTELAAQAASLLALSRAAAE